MPALSWEQGRPGPGLVTAGEWLDPTQRLLPHTLLPSDQQKPQGGCSRQQVHLRQTGVTGGAPPLYHGDHRLGTGLPCPPEACGGT